MGRKSAVPYGKYNHSGVYSISLGGKIVYVGRSNNMRKRIVSHMNLIKNPEKVSSESGPNKYQVLNEAYNRGLLIQFDVLYDGDDIVFQEGYYINKLRPILNMAIPRADDNFRSNKINLRAVSITLDELLDGEWQYNEEELTERQSAKEANPENPLI